MNNYIHLNTGDLLKENISDRDCRIECFNRNTSGYNIHVICCQFSSKHEIEINWEELVGNVADNIQKKLDEIIEVYNIYILFFQPELDENLVNKIERNRFSSRKMVVNKDMPVSIEILEKFVEQKLFELEIEKVRESGLISEELQFLDKEDIKENERALEIYISKKAGVFNEKNK